MKTIELEKPENEATVWGTAVVEQSSPWEETGEGGGATCSQNLLITSRCKTKEMSNKGDVKQRRCKTKDVFFNLESVCIEDTKHFKHLFLCCQTREKTRKLTA